MQCVKIDVLQKYDGKNTNLDKCLLILDSFIHKINVNKRDMLVVIFFPWILFQELSRTSTYLIRRMEPLFPLHDVW